MTEVSEVGRNEGFILSSIPGRVRCIPHVCVGMDQLWAADRRREVRFAFLRLKEKKTRWKDEPGSGRRQGRSDRRVMTHHARR